MKFSKNIRPSQRGFTLIELMIVVAIIGILSAVAVPAYNDYTQRAQASEAFSLVDGMKTAISVFAQENGTYPASTDIASGVGSTVYGKYSSATTAAGTGVITVIMYGVGATAPASAPIPTPAGADIAGKFFTFTPPQTITGATSFPFACASNAKQKYVPKTCAGA